MEPYRVADAPEKEKQPSNLVRAALSFGIPFVHLYRVMRDYGRAILRAILVAIAIICIIGLPTTGMYFLSVYLIPIKELAYFITTITGLAWGFYIFYSLSLFSPDNSEFGEILIKYIKEGN